MNFDNPPDPTKLTPIAWDKAFETGHPGVDADHQRLVGMLGDLYAAAHAEADVQRLLAILVELQRYCVYHFGRESKLMTEFGVSEVHCNAHRLAHRTFVSTVNEAVHAAARDPSVVTHDLLRFLGHWLQTHILGMDRDLVHEITRLGQETVPPQSSESPPPNGSP